MTCASIPVLAFCFDANAVPSFFVAYKSLVHHLSRSALVHCLTRHVPELHSLSHPHAPIVQIDVTNVSINTYIDSYLSGNRTPRSTFDRLLLPRLLPHDITHCLYLDTDAIAVGDIAQFLSHVTWGQLGLCYRPSTGSWLSMRAAARDMQGESLLVSMGKSDWQHGNVGVLAMHLADLRVTGLADRCCDVAGEYHVNDQLAINYVARGRFGHLPLEYNVYANKECIADTPNARILHFAGPCKPWLSRAQCTTCQAAWHDHYRTASRWWRDKASPELRAICHTATSTI